MVFFLFLRKLCFFANNFEFLQCIFKFICSEKKKNETSNATSLFSFVYRENLQPRNII